MPIVDNTSGIVNGVVKSNALAVTGEQPIVLAPGSDELNAPKTRIPTAFGAYAVYTSVRNAHIRRCKTYGRIQGMIDGNPPYSRDSVKRGGMLASSNVNWRDGEAFIESVSLAYWSLFNDVQCIAKVETDISAPYENPVIGKIVSEEFDRALRGWSRFSSLMNQHQLDLIKFGASYIFWPDEDDWRFDVADVWRFLVPERTRNHEDFITICFIEHVMNAQEIWDIIDMEDAGDWNKDVLKAVLIFNANLGNRQKTYTDQFFGEIQQMIRNGDTRMDQLYNDDILFISAFIKEYDGSVSRGIFQPNMPGLTNGKFSGKLNQNDYAFFSQSQYREMKEAFKIFTFTPGERYLHGLKGIGHRIFNTVEGMTQLDNSLMDALRRGSTVLVRTRAGKNRDLKQIQFMHGGFVDVGESEFIQNLMGANLAPNVQGVQYFRSKLEANNNISGAFMNSPDGKPRTLGEVRFQATKEARVQKNRIAHYYEQLDYLFREIFRKMLKNKSDPVVKRMMERCEQRGVPKEFFELSRANEGQNGLPDHMDITATRASGSGSQVADQIETQTMMQILPVLGEKGREAVVEDFIAANRGYRYIDRYYPQEDRENSPSDEESTASVENNQLEKGEMVVVGNDQNHAIHAKSHLARLQQIAQGFNEAEMSAREAGSETPQIDAGQYGNYSLFEVDIAFQTVGPHFVRHLLFLSQDPTRKDLAKSLNAKWAILANYGDKIANNAQEARDKQIRDLRKQDEQMSAMEGEERLKMAEIEMNGRLKLRKLEEDSQRSARRDQLQFLLGRMKVSFENEVKKAKAISEIGIAQAKAAAEEISEQEKVSGKERSEVF